MTTEPRIVYPYCEDGATRSWSVPYRGDEPADSIQVDHDPRADPAWTGHYARGGWPRAALSATELEQALVGIELRDLRDQRIQR